MARPEQTRTHDPEFVRSCGFSALQDRLPLRWPTPAGTVPSPKLRYRSGYQYLSWDELTDPACWVNFDDFDLLLRLVDFSGLRDVLAERLGWTSAKGKVPFDPVSLCLLTLWQIVNGWSRAETLRNLQKAALCRLCRTLWFPGCDFPQRRRTASLLDLSGRKLKRIKGNVYLWRKASRSLKSVSKHSTS